MTSIDDDIRDLKQQPLAAWASWAWQRIAIGGSTIWSAFFSLPTLYMLGAFAGGSVVGGTMVAEPTAPLRGWLEAHSFVTPIPVATPVTYTDGSQQVLGQLQRISADITTKFGQIATEIKTSRDLAAGYDINASAVAESIKADIKAIPGAVVASMPKPQKIVVHDKPPPTAKP